MTENGADIQVEHGNWAKVHNVILEKLAAVKMDGREAKCLFLLLRMTYGNQQKDHEISLSLWADSTGIDKRHVKPVVDRLIQRNIIYRIDGKRGRGNTAVYGFNKYFGQWDSEQKVPSTVPIKKVLHTVPIAEKKVPSTVPEKVPSTVPIQERKKTTTTEGRGSSAKQSNLDADFGLLCAKYENNFGALTSVIGDDIGDLLNDYPVGWISDAMDIAVRQEKRKMSYVAGVLKRWRAEGRSPPDAAVNGISGNVSLGLDKI